MLSLSHDSSESARLAALTAQYLKAGNEIESLPGPSFTPPPLRTDPPPSKKKPRRQLVSSSIKDYREFGPKAVEMYEQDLPIKDISRALGRSDSFTLHCLAYFGIDAKAERAARRKAGEAEFLQQLKMLAKDGHSVRYICEQTGATDTKVRYHAQRLGLTLGGGK